MIIISDVVAGSMELMISSGNRISRWCQEMAQLRSLRSGDIHFYNFHNTVQMQGLALAYLITGPPMSCISRSERPLGLKWRSSKLFIGTTAFVASFTVRLSSKVDDANEPRRDFSTQRYEV